MKEPLVSIALQAYTRIFAPGDELVADFQIDAVEPGEVEAVEASVLWYTEGKGDEDLGVHFFKRFDGRADGGRTEDGRGDGSQGDDVPLHELRTIRTTLPHAPLSYDGRIVKIRWCVRVRAFLNRGRFVVADQWFQLGSVASPSQGVAEIGGVRGGHRNDPRRATSNGQANGAGGERHAKARVPGTRPDGNARPDDGERASTLATH